MSEETLAVAEPLVILDPAQVEAEMLEEQRQRDNDPIENAARLFKAYHKGYENAVKKLSSKSKTRLLKALVLAPLENAPLVNKEEHEAYFYGDSMLQAKFIMQMAVYKDSAEEIAKMQDELKTDFVYGDEAKTIQEGE